MLTFLDFYDLLTLIYSFVVHSVKTRVKKSKVWDFFKKDPKNKKISVCMICNMKFVAVVIQVIIGTIYIATMPPN